MTRTLVVGGTGKVGREVVAGLLARRAPVRVATRQPDRAREAAPEAESVAFDYDRPETFAAAVAGVERLFLSVRPGDEAADATALPLVDEALRAGVRRVVTLTAMGVDRMPGNALRRIERHVEASGAAWTHLRPNFFMQIFSTPPLVDQVRAVGSLRLPAGQARLSFVDVRDIGAVAVGALLDEGHAGRAYTLTGSEALDHAGVAAAISRVTARPVTYVAVEDDEARGLMAANGLPLARIDRLLAFYRLVRAGACSPVSTDVARVLGRAPIAFAQFTEDHAAAWRRPGSSPHTRDAAPPPSPLSPLRG